MFMVGDYLLLNMASSNIFMESTQTPSSENALDLLNSLEFYTIVTNCLLWSILEAVSSIDLHALQREPLLGVRMHVE